MFVDKYRNCVFCFLVGLSLTTGVLILNVNLKFLGGLPPVERPLRQNRARTYGLFASFSPLVPQNSHKPPPPPPAYKVATISTSNGLDELALKQANILSNDTRTDIVVPESSNLPVLKIAVFVYEKNPKDKTWILGKNTFQSCVLQKPTKFAYNLVQVTPTEIRNGDLMSQNFDVIWIGGGIAPTHAVKLQKKGMEAIVEFVQVHGRGYIGCCAGAYLALVRPNGVPATIWHMGLVKCDTIDLDNWERGVGGVLVEYNDKAMEILLNKEQTENTFEYYYQNGPLFGVSTQTYSDLPHGDIIGKYVTEKSKKDSEGVMLGTGAIASSQSKKGRVVLFSAHPESSSPTIASHFVNAFHWVKQ